MTKREKIAALKDAKEIIQLDIESTERRIMNTSNNSAHSFTEGSDAHLWIMTQRDTEIVENNILPLRYRLWFRFKRVMRKLWRWFVAWLKKLFTAFILAVGFWTLVWGGWILRLFFQR